MIRRFNRERKVFGLAVAWSNLRFDLGYKIGGFTSATRRK